MLKKTLRCLHISSFEFVKVYHFPDKSEGSTVEETCIHYLLCNLKQYQTSNYSECMFKFLHKICQITCGFQTFIRKLNTNTLRFLLQGNSRQLSQSMKEPEFVHQKKLKGKFIKFGWSLHYR